MREELKYWIGYLCWLGEGAIRFAAVAVGNYNLRSDLLAALVTLRANLYADYYDVLPTIAGQKSWPPIKRGDTWDLNGKPVPYTADELDPDQPGF